MDNNKMINTKTSCWPIESIDYFAFLPIGEFGKWEVISKDLLNQFLYPSLHSIVLFLF